MVKPAWMADTGLGGATPQAAAPPGQLQPPHIPPQQPNQNGSACLSSASLGGLHPATPVEQEPLPQASPWEAMSSGPSALAAARGPPPHAAAPRPASSYRSAEPLAPRAPLAPAGGVPSGLPGAGAPSLQEQHWGDLPCPSRPLFGVELEVPRGFQAPGPGAWLACEAGDHIFVERQRGQLVFASSGDREGWLELEAVQPSRSKHPEFQVQIPVRAASKRLGLAFTEVSGPLRGLAVAMVLPDSMVHDYNQGMAAFPRSQVQPGDVITWAGGEQEPAAMRRVLHHWRSLPTTTLRLRVNRVGLCLLAPRGTQPTAAGVAALAGVVPRLLSESERPGPPLFAVVPPGRGAGPKTPVLATAPVVATGNPSRGLSSFQ